MYLTSKDILAIAEKFDKWLEETAKDHNALKDDIQTVIKMLLTTT